MKPAEIKAALIRKGIKNVDIAQQANCSKVQVSKCINGDGVYMNIRQLIATALEKEVEQIFNEHHPEPKNVAVV